MANITKKCIYCQKEFDTTDYLVGIKKGKYCSRFGVQNWKSNV